MKSYNHFVQNKNRHQPFLSSPNLLIITQTKNPTNVGLDVVEKVNLFKQYHLLSLPELTSLDHIDVHSSRYRLTKVVGGL
jgi:hypothetical protein